MAAVLHLQGVASLLWNEMTRLTDTDFMYKALPSGPHKQAPKLPTNPLNAQRASIKANEDGVGVSGCACPMHECTCAASLQCTGDRGYDVTSWLVKRQVCQ